jgi:hypothetical protein
MTRCLASGWSPPLGRASFAAAKAWTTKIPISFGGIVGAVLEAYLPNVLDLVKSSSPPHGRLKGSTNWDA